MPLQLGKLISCADSFKVGLSGAISPTRQQRFIRRSVAECVVSRTYRRLSDVPSILGTILLRTPKHDKHAAEPVQNVKFGEMVSVRLSHLVPKPMLSVRHFSRSAALCRVSLTFFTKETCQLCKNASGILKKTLDQEPFRDVDLTVVDIMKPENSAAFDKYCYDVPVLHVDRPGQKKPVKFMHYFDEAKLAEEFARE